MFQNIKCLLNFHSWSDWLAYAPLMEWQRRTCERTKCDAYQLRDHPAKPKKGWV